MPQKPAALTQHPTAYLVHAVFLVAGHVEAAITRANHTLQNLQPTERRNGPICVLCGGHMGPAQTRPERDARRPSGQVFRIAGERLVWRTCTKCGRHATGEAPAPQPWYEHES